MATVARRAHRLRARCPGACRSPPRSADGPASGFWRTVPATATPAERTSSSISSKCSSSGTMPITRARSFWVSPAALVTRANSSSRARMVASTSKSSWWTSGAWRRSKGSAVMTVAVRSQGSQMRELDAAGQAVRQHLDRGHQVEPQQGEVVEVVAGERLALQMGVDEPQAAEAADAAAQAADVGQGQAVGVAHDDVADDAVAPEQDSDLPVEPAGGLGQMPGELGGDHLPRIDPAAVGALQGADFGRFDPSDVAVDLGNVGSPLSGSVEDRGRVVARRSKGARSPFPSTSEAALLLRPGRPPRAGPVSPPGGRGGPRRGR